MQKELGNVFFHLMRELLQDHTALWQKSLPELTKQQYAVLCAVEAEPGIEQLDLTEAALSTKATLAELLVRMEKKNLIERQQGTTDRRRRFIFLTTEGKRVLLEARPIAEQVDTFFLSRLGEQQQNEVVVLLKSMLAKGESGR
ncbi:MarR family winged helix-turn-helix transcriptional regulator [Pantoea phytobeneficialis]|uniref:Transcriptional regulator n=1 Tax=Pantoea phytobeneficialis TaxID=2052056 RepID=A0AAP9H8U9_9GAMM|nr:MarR family transcriptional regulator [Pantoea phytobeneficialis]MDO6409438.1 MarR family transcriptional regulator [Pantoea phytobeneficialis]QGR08915.1 transcriptional regulator [Pantoea phytobeneficialis]